MTRKENQLLRDLIKSVIRINKQPWNDLKRAILESGYQSIYYESAEFLTLIERRVFKLDPKIKLELMTEWQKFESERGKITYDNFNSSYTMLILGEIRRRAELAAMRTWNWDY